MKKRILIAVAAVCIAGGGVALFAENNFVILMSKQQFRGCVNQPDRNNGHCATDGTYYLCENEGRHDCVKGQYLPPDPN